MALYKDYFYLTAPTGSGEQRRQGPSPLLRGGQQEGPAIVEDRLRCVLHRGDDPRVTGEGDDDGFETSDERAAADEADPHRGNVLGDRCA